MTEAAIGEETAGTTPVVPKPTLDRTEVPCMNCKSPLDYNRTSGMYVCSSNCGVIMSPECLISLEAVHEKANQAVKEMAAMNSGREQAFATLIKNCENPNKLIPDFIAGQAAVKQIEEIRKIIDKAVKTAQSYPSASPDKAAVAMSISILEISMVIPPDIAGMIKLPPPPMMAGPNDSNNPPTD